MTQAQLDARADKLVNEYADRVTVAPDKNKRVMGIQVDAAWQIERKYIANCKRLNQLAEQLQLKPPFDPNKIGDVPDEPNPLTDL
tara:strand:- start:186 stop:440 length:255 start_codon:yes stop_codon:yes gene_type:complete